ncbi:MAG: hypothetical protein RLZZ299_1432, partial [Pseudomonadota bacterium]
CDGMDGRDADRDGYASRETGGTDCDDHHAPLVNPGASDPLATGADENCDGVNGVDADDDGYAAGAGDCDDANSLRHWGALDRVGDSVDQDCDGADGVDADGDTVASSASGGTDCDDDASDDVTGQDGAADVHPAFPDGAGGVVVTPDLTVDGIDQDCSGIDGIDDDGDGYASFASGGRDCDDTPVTGRTINPGVPDTTVDGIDQDCADGDANDAERDADGDGFVSAVFGGDDCDDANPALNPSATDLVGDGGDQNCDGLDGYDGDGDGFAASWSGGTDCDDDASDDVTGHVPAADVHPDSMTSVTPDPGGDGTDQNCDGVDGIDLDGDGYASVTTGGTDCNDADASVRPGMTDGAAAGDQDCDGLADEDVVRDLDGDGFDSVLFAGGTDCNDLNAAINPMATDLAGDTFDQNCDGVDGYDGDGDGVAAPWSGGTDCRDTDPTVAPGLTTDTTIDGIDQDCDNVDGIDADHDGYATDALTGGLDCDDTDARIHPAATDLRDGVDDDCDGIDANDVPAPTDYDRDGFATVAEGGLDCDDHNGAINPYATDIVGDGRDQNCDGIDGTDADGDEQASLLSGGIDCDDTDGTVYAGAAAAESVSTDDPAMPAIPACTRDLDEDGWGDDTVAVDAYYVITGGYWVAPFVGSDCDDSDAAVAPDVLDVNGSDGIDSNCDGSDADDNDGDGSVDLAAGGLDCQDMNPQIVEDSLDPRLCGYDEDGDGQILSIYAFTGFGESTGTGTDTGPDDVVTSCTIQEVGRCIELRNDPNAEAFCDSLAAIVPLGTEFAEAPCAPEGQMEGFCEIDADASPQDPFLSDARMYYYGSVSSAEAAIDCRNNTRGTWNGPGAAGFGPLPTVGSDCDDENPMVYTGSLPLEGADVCAHDFDGDGYGWDVDGGTDCVEYLSPYSPEEGDAFITARVVTTFGTQSDVEVGDLVIDMETARAIHPGEAALEPSLCTLDVDGDGYGVMPGQVRTFVDQGTTMVVTLLAFSFDAGTDCDDEDMDVFPGALANEPASVCAQDGDGDGYGAFTDGGHDCDDTDAAIVPTPEVCNGIDDNCDGTVDNNGVDVDQDGSPSCLDCDDQDPDRSPLLREACDGEVDNDCNPATRENLDSDGDGFSVCAGDCAENNAAVRPGWLPLENNPGLCADDMDGDGWGAVAQGGSDCNDNDPRMHPDRFNGVCGRDSDNDGSVDVEQGGSDCEDADNTVLPDMLNEACGADQDGDGYVGQVFGGTDCNDTAAYWHPGAAEWEPNLCAADEDEDGWASMLDGGSDCVDVPMYEALYADPTGTQAMNVYGSVTYPGAAEHEPWLCASDADGDGYGDSRQLVTSGGFEPGSDCDDGSTSVHPGTNESGACGEDWDGDGYVSTLDGGSDCSDVSANVGSNLTDANCDGVTDTGCTAEVRVTMGTQVLLTRTVSVGNSLPMDAFVVLNTSGATPAGTTFDDFIATDTVGFPVTLAMSTFDTPQAGDPAEWAAFNMLGDPGTYVSGGVGVADADDNTFQFMSPLPLRYGLRAEVDVDWGMQTAAVGIMFADASSGMGYPAFAGGICAGGPSCGASYPVVSVSFADAGTSLNVRSARVALPHGMDPRSFQGPLSLSVTPAEACFDMDGDGQNAVAAGGLDCDDMDPDVFLGAAANDGMLCAADDDGDGYAALADGGRDCDAFNPNVHPDGAVQSVCGMDGDADGLVGVADGGSDCNDSVPGRGSCAVSAGSVTWPSFTFDATTGWTVEAWVYAGSSPGDSGHFFRTWGCGAADATMSYYSDLYGFFVHGTVSTPRAETGIGVRTNQWVHVAATYTSTGSKLFVAGSLVGTSTSSTSGTCASASTGLSGNLLVDAMRISDGVLYTTSFTPPTTLVATAGTKALYQFDEGYGTVTNDASPQRKHGTWGDAPVWVPGR